MSPPSSLPDAGKLAEARYPQGMNQPQQSQLEVEETLPPHRTGSTLDAEVVGRGQSSGDGEGVQVIVDEKGAGSDLLDSPPSSSSSSTEFVKADEARRSSQPGSEMADVTAPPDSRAATDDDDDEAVQRPSLSDASDRAEGYDPYATPTGRAEADEGDDSSQRAICRICLEGPGDTSDDGESLGRLLSPCRCKGTMKYVHATCLDRWRALSARTSSGVACDQCGAPYRFRQSRFVGLATSPSLLFGLSVFLFLALIWTTGLVASLVLQRYDNSLVPDTSSAPTSKAEANTAAPAGQGTSRGWHGWMTGDDQEAQTAWEVQDGYSYWGYTGFYYEPWAYAKLVREAVRQFTSGEATEAVKGLVGLDAEVDDEREEAPGPQADADADEPAEQEQSFWSALKWEWKYGEGGIWQGQQPVEQQAAEAAAAAGSAVQGPGDKAPTADEAQKGQGDEAPRPPRERYDARNARPYDTQKSRKARASRQSRSRSRSRKAAASTAQPGWLDKLLLQFSLGFSLIGIVSFLNLLLGLPFLGGPLNLNFGLGRTFARFTRSSRRNQPAHNDGTNLASIVLVLLVVIGIVSALMQVYKAVRKLATRLLARLEEVVVDWYGEDEVDAARNGGENAEEQRHRRWVWGMARAGE